ncbi:hypothetical protein D3C76_1304810 [compost metagenome]
MEKFLPSEGESSYVAGYLDFRKCVSLKRKFQRTIGSKLGYKISIIFPLRVHGIKQGFQPILA